MNREDILNEARKDKRLKDEVSKERTYLGNNIAMIIAISLAFIFYFKSEYIDGQDSGEFALILAVLIFVPAVVFAIKERDSNVGRICLFIIGSIVFSIIYLGICGLIFYLLLRFF